MARLSQHIVNHAKVVIALILVVSGLLAYQIKNIEVNSDIIDSLPDKDPDAVLLKEVGEKFGGNRLGIVILKTEDIYTQEALTHIVQITDSLSEIESIQSVTSLSNIIEIREGEYGIEVGPLIDSYQIPSSPQEYENLRARIEANDMYRGSLISEDGTASLVIFSLTSEAEIHEVSSQVREMISRMNLPEEIYYTGSPMLVSSISKSISRDMSRLIPITFLVIGLVLFLGFRSFKGVVLPLIGASLSIVWTIGAMALGGFKMSMVSSNIPILLLAVGSAYSIHVVNRIAIERKNMALADAVRTSLLYVFIPVLLSAITTSIGFASFTFGSYLSMILEYGLFTAFGTLVSCFLSLTLVPAILSLSKDKKQQGSNQAQLNFQKLLLPLYNAVTKKPKSIFIGWIIFIMIGVGGIFLIKREVDVKNYFQKRNPTRIAEEIMEEKFGGTKPVFVLFSGDIQDPMVLKTMLDVEKHMKASPDIKNTQSIADIVVQLNKSLGKGAIIPENRAVIEQLWFLIDGNEYVGRLASEDLDQAIIISTFLSPDNQSKITFAKHMNDFIDQINIDGLNVQITGMPFVDVTMDDSLVKSQTGSLTIAVISVVILVSFIFRSFRSGLKAALPIIATIIILFGMMGFFGIPLNIGTVLVASVALGIGIDYSIHIISHFNSSLKKGLGPAEAIKDAILITGNAIVINVISVAGGFSVLLISEMVPLQYFGLLVAISMIGSGLGSLTLLPTILLLTHKTKK